MFNLIFNQQVLIQIVDIALVIVVVSRLFKAMRGTKGVFLLNGLLILFLVFTSGRYLNLQIFSRLLDLIMSMLIVAIPIIFQNELKRALESLGRKNPMIKWFIKTPAIAAESVDVIAEAAKSLARQKIGALIVLERDNPLLVVNQSGSYLDAVLSRIMIEQVFYPNSPLHDGAIVIKDNRIQAAGCFLPLDNELSLPQELGSRHRAGLSLATQSDALVIVISEESGSIGIAYNGTLETMINAEKLKLKLHELIHPVPSALNQTAVKNNSNINASKTEVG